MSALDLAWSVSIRPTLLLVVVLSFCVLRPRSAPGLRHLALAIGIAGFAVVPLAGAVLPWSIESPISLEISPTHLVEQGTSVGPAAGNAAQSLAVSFASVALIVWLAGSAVMLARLVAGGVAAVHLRRAARDPGRSYPTGAGRRVRVLFSSCVDQPLAVGLFRPAVLVPAVARNWSAVERRAVIAHELAHLRRSDGWTLLLGCVVRALYWPNPFVWIGVRWLRRASDEACDEAALRSGMSRIEYAQLLVRLARRARRTRLPVPALIPAGTLEARVKVLLGPGRRPAHARHHFVVAGLLLVAAGCLSTVRGVPRPGDVAAHAVRYGIEEELAESILRAASLEGVDASLAFGLVSVESGFDAGRTSRRGAVGLAQVLPSTAAQLRPGITVEQLRRTDINLRMGFRLLRSYLDRFPGDRERALLAYHAGPNAVGREGAPASDYPNRVLRAAGGVVPDM